MHDEDEKEKTIKNKEELKSELEALSVIITSCLQDITTTYQELYLSNNARVDSKHINGISSLTNSSILLIDKRNSIINEIDELKSTKQIQPENPYNQINGKAAMLKHIKTKGDNDD